MLSLESCLRLTAKIALSRVLDHICWHHSGDLYGFTSHVLCDMPVTLVGVSSCWDTPHFWGSAQTFYVVFIPARQKCGVSLPFIDGGPFCHFLYLSTFVTGCLMGGAAKWLIVWGVMAPWEILLCRWVFQFAEAKHHDGLDDLPIFKSNSTFHDCKLWCGSTWIPFKKRSYSKGLYNQMFQSLNNECIKYKVEHGCTPFLHAVALLPCLSFSHSPQLVLLLLTLIASLVPSLGGEEWGATDRAQRKLIYTYIYNGFLLTLVYFQTNKSTHNSSHIFKLLFEWYTSEATNLFIWKHLSPH
jgi:hypothetical protein